MVELKPATNQTEPQPHLTLHDFAGDLRRARRAKALIVATLALAFAGVTFPSVISIRSAHAGPQSYGVSAKPVLDDDGDDTRYHWQNPAYAAEEALQMGAIILLLGSFAIHAKIKRARSRSSK